MILRKRKKSKPDKVHRKSALIDHLKALRRTIISCIVTILIGTIVCYEFFKANIMSMAIKPLEGIESDMIYTSVAESFVTEMWVALLAGIVITIPITFSLIWHFISPALFKAQRRWTVCYTIIAMILFCMGLGFAYFVLLPFSLEFLINDSSVNAEAMLSISSYINFLCKILIAFGIVFEMPLITFIVIKFRIMTVRQVVKLRKYLIVICFFIAAVITPPDVISQLYVAIPMYLMYEIGILFGKVQIWCSERRKNRRNC